MSVRAYALALLAILGTIPACLHGRAFAQDDDEQLVLDIVRLTAHEAGVDSPGDADGIYAVLVTGASEHGISTHAFARAHSPRFFAGRTTRPWALELQLDCARPRSFRGRWEEPRASGARSGTTSRRDACLALVAHVREVVSSPPTCDAQTWGNAHDHERLVARGVAFRLVVCGPLPARNLFSRRIARRSR